MDPNRFDALSRSMATRSNRRSAVRGISAGGIAAGLLTTLGLGRIRAADQACAFKITATTSAGPNEGTTYSGMLNMRIGDDGAIDEGSFDTDDGESFDLVGQASGRALNLRITLADDKVLTLSGTSAVDLVLCRGAAAGTFGGPDDGDLGTWRTGDSSGSGGGSGSGSGGGASSGGGSSSSGDGGSGNSGGTSGGNNGGGDTGGGDNSSGGTSDCPSGVVCDGVCCQPRPGFTPDSISCDSGCACTYSCQSAGCPNGGTEHGLTIGCDDRPNALCGEFCNFPDESSCEGMTCSDTQQLDVATCTCIDAGLCGPGQTNCGTDDSPDCRDLTVDGENCGSCGTVCPLGLCEGGVCA